MKRFIEKRERKRRCVSKRAETRARGERERERERERRRGRRLAERRWRSSDRTMWTSSYVALEKSRNPKKKELSRPFFFSLQLTRFRFSAAGRVRVQGGQERQGADVSPGGDASPRQEGWSTLSLFFFSCLLTTAFELRAISVFSQQLEDLRKHEDPRLSFSTPEFREAQRIFTDNFKKNFGKPVEWAFVKKHAWSKPQLVKLDKPVRASRGDLPHTIGIPRG